MKNVFVSLGSEYKVILVASSQGLVVGDIQPLTRLNVTCIAEENGNRQIGSFGGGGRVEFGFLSMIKTGNAMLAKRCARRF